MFCTYSRHGYWSPDYLVAKIKLKNFSPHSILSLQKDILPEFNTQTSEKLVRSRISNFIFMMLKLTFPVFLLTDLKDR